MPGAPLGWLVPPVGAWCPVAPGSWWCLQPASIWWYPVGMCGTHCACCLLGMTVLGGAWCKRGCPEVPGAGRGVRCQQRSLVLAGIPVPDSALWCPQSAAAQQYTVVPATCGVWCPVMPDARQGCAVLGGACIWLCPAVSVAQWCRLPTAWWCLLVHAAHWCLMVPFGAHCSLLPTMLVCTQQ